MKKKQSIAGTTKTIIASILMLAAFLTTAFAFDNRYLHVVDFQKYTEQNKKDALEDKIFALEMKQNKDQKDKAFLERYKRQLDEVNKRLGK